MSTMWCNNGDAISMQYAGTAALKVWFLSVDFWMNKKLWFHFRKRIMKMNVN